MRKKIEWQWENVDSANENKFQTMRAKVIGGWIVKTIIMDLKLKLITSSSVFIPDRDHEWTIVPPMKLEKPPSKVIAADFESSKEIA